MSENWRISKDSYNLACSPWNGAICIEIAYDTHVPPIVAWTTRGSEDKANLIAAAPTMLEYISKCAASGDVEAAQILDSIDVRGINKNISPEEREHRRKWMSDFRRAAIVKAIGEHKDAGTDTA
jgi:hypothetical protein